mgnify:CR=1 FL=1
MYHATARIMNVKFAEACHSQLQDFNLRYHRDFALATLHFTGVGAGVDFVLENARFDDLGLFQCLPWTV